MTPTPHNSAKPGQFAKTVLMPGDPLRAKYIAEHYLENAELVNCVRGINGYTGYYNGKRVSVMASGMGQPSIGIYSYELYRFYDVENIIRIGTCGALHEDMHVRDIVIAVGACTDSAFANQYRLPGTFCPIADFSLAQNAMEQCMRDGYRAQAGNILSSDHYYDDACSIMEWTKMGVLAVEMESAALYCVAARAGKHALCLCSVSNSLVRPEEHITAEEAQTSLDRMIRVALEIAPA